MHRLARLQETHVNEQRACPAPVSASVPCAHARGMRLAFFEDVIRERITVAADEVANVATHGLGLVVSLAAFPLLVLLAAREGDAGIIVGVSIFAATLVGVYAASTIYHVMPVGPRKQFWKELDQTAVYLLIAGTYTPFTLGVLRGPWG